METWINRARATIYIVGIGAFILAAYVHKADAFWPADMVPHPNMPEETYDPRDCSDPRNQA